MRVHIATDHAGFELKEEIVADLREKGYDVVDHGAHVTTPSTTTRRSALRQRRPLWMNPVASASLLADRVTVNRWLRIVCKVCAPPSCGRMLPLV